MNLKHILVTRPEIQNKLFNSIVGKNGKTYLYNGNSNSIWVDGDQEGSGGRTLSYEMMDGDVISLKGPWQANAKDLLEQTGIDLTRIHPSFGLVFETRKEALDFEAGKDVDPLIMDNMWVFGEFEGGKERMKEQIKNLQFANRNLQIVNISSLGGVSIETFNTTQEE